MAMKSLNANMRKTKDSESMNLDLLKTSGYDTVLSVLWEWVKMQSFVCWLFALGAQEKWWIQGPASPRPRIEKSSNPILTQWKPK